MKEVKDYLLKYQDLDYFDFSKNLNALKEYKSIGVRIPILRNYAKILSKKYSLDFLINNIDDEYYEEILLKGFCIGNYNDLSFDDLTKYINLHLLKIRDWSMCDTFVASLKITKKYLESLWPFLLTKLNSSKEFDIRFSLVMILNYYINDTYKDQIYEIIKNVSSDAYYVKMANAWLISYMFIKYFDETVLFIKNNQIDKWVASKGITKAIESFKISSDQKNYLRELRNELK